MASPQSSSLAAPLHVQHLVKALRLDPFLGYLEGVFTDPYLANISEDESELSDNETEPPNKSEGLLNGTSNGLTINGSLSRDELRIDKTRLYNFSKVKKDRRWLKEVLLSDSSDSSCDEDDEAPMMEEDLQEMLWLHKQQKLAQQMYYIDKDLCRYQHYSASLLSNQDKYYEFQKQSGSKKLKRKKLKDGKVKFPKDKKDKDKVKVKKKKKKSDDLDDDQRQLTLEERIIKKTLIRRKEADAKRRKLWALIVRKEIPRAHRQKSSARNNMLTNCKKLTQLCQKEMRKEAQRSQKVTQQTAPKARRLSREMLLYWKKYEKVEKEHRKRAEKEAMEQRKLDDEFSEVRRQQRKLNFLITQTELYAHFMSKKLKGAQADEGTHNILRKLDEPSAKQNVKTVQGGVLIDMENADTYDADEMKSQALSNARRAIEDQEARTQEFDNNYQQETGKKVAMSQATFDQSFSLANPMIDMKQAHPQPTIFQGVLKSYQLKGMNWLINLYEQGINGILADEMGLGKTVQSIAFLSYLAETHSIWGPFLVVAPASTLHNWQQEVSRFVPQFKVLPYWGNQGDRKSLRKYWTQNQVHINDYENAPFHVLITSYQLVVQDVRYFQRIKWQYLVLDEAQAIKSSSSVRWRILLGFLCRNRLLLTGTPIQNSMAELWALLHFIMPTLFDSHEEFNEWFSKDIENHAENKTAIDQDQLSRLHMILKPFMLRRIKRDVENELSEKIEIKLVCHLTTRQRWLYQAVRNKISIDDLVYTSTSSSSTNATTSSLMNLVMQFRKVCNHPELFERRDVRSPIHVEVPSFHLPKLIYREGILEFSTPSRTKIFYNLLNIGTEEYIQQSLNSDHSGQTAVPSSNCFSFLRFINLSPAQLSATMLKGLVFRLLALVILLKEVSILHHQRYWAQDKPKNSRCLGRQGLILWPDSTTSFPSIQSSSVLPSLVFTGYTKRVSSHLTHNVQPILDDDDHKPHRGKAKEQSKGTRTRRTSSSAAVSPTSPTKRKEPRQRGSHGHHKVISPTGKIPPSPLKHSPTGPFSPTKHYGHSFLPQLSPNRHHGLPLSASWPPQHPHGPHPGEFHMDEHHSSLGHAPMMHYPSSQESSMMHSSPGYGPSSLHSPTGHVLPPLYSPPGHSTVHQMQPFSPTRHGSSLLTTLPGGFHLNPAPRVLPIDRTLQPTPLPSFLSTHIPRVTAGTDVYRCSDRSSAYEIQKLLQGGSELCRNLLLYGTPDLGDVNIAKHHLFPAPLGGLEGSVPETGWSFVQIPDRNALITDSGKLTVLDGLLRKLKMQGHRVLIYSQMTRMIDLLEEYMTYRKHKYMRLDGSSKISDRRDMVADFQSKADIFVFLLSTRAGGLGINLTAADTVIFYDSDWNPTVDQQAMDRAHRLGQTRQVTVYRLVTKGSIEERILQRAKEKSEIQNMVISGGHFKPEALKPKEVVSLLLDDAELECKFLQRQAEKKADEQRRRRERKRKKGGPAEADEVASPTIDVMDETPPAKARKGRKSKSSLVPPAPEGSMSSSKPASETSSITGEGLSVRTGEGFDGDGTVGDDISVLSLDEVSLASGDLLMDVPPSNTGTPLSLRPEGDDFDDPRSETASPALSDTSSKRGRGKGRGRGRGRGLPTGRSRGSSSIRGTRTRARGRGTGGALAASAAASAAAAAASAAAYAAYGFSFQGTGTPNPTPPSARSSPVAFGAGGSVVSGYSNISHPVARYDNSAGYSPVQSSENSPARSSSQASARFSQQSTSPL